MLLIKKFPVIIVATPRTGSTALLKKVAQEYSLRQIAEPYMPIKEILNLPTHKQKGIASDRQKLLSCLEKNENKFVLKLMVSELSYITPYPNILQTEAYKIQLMRQNVDQQIASLYIATETARYHQTANQQVFDFILPIKKMQLINCIETIYHSNFICENLPYRFDQKIWYEDLGFMPNAYTADGSYMTITCKPTNYNEILQEINNLLKLTKKWV